MPNLRSLLGGLAHTDDLAQAPTIGPGMGQVEDADKAARAFATTNIHDIGPDAPNPGVAEAGTELDESIAEALVEATQPKRPGPLA